MSLMNRKRHRKFSLKYFWAFEEAPEEIVASGGSETAPVETPSFDWNTVIPEDLREKEHFKNILGSENPGSELVKQFQNAQELIGKRPSGVPADDASEEDWNKFIESARPKELDAYDIKPVDLGEEKKEIAEMMNASRDEEFVKGVKQMFHDVGVPKRMAEQLASKWDALIAPQVEKQLQAQKDLDAGFEKLLDENFGKDKDKAIEYGKKFLNDFTPEEMKQYTPGLPNEMLILAAAMGQAVHKKYETEDSFTPTGGHSAKTVAEINKEINDLMATPAYDSKLDSAHESTRAKVRTLIEQKAALESKAT